MTRMKTADIIRKYTGVDWAEADIGPGTLRQRLAEDVKDAARRLGYTEESLVQTARKLRDVAAKIEANVDAGPDDLVYQLNELGELQSTNVDALVAKRAVQIATLRVLVHTLLEE
jgi:hypothetical protein